MNYAVKHEGRQKARIPVPHSATPGRRNPYPHRGRCAQAARRTRVRRHDHGGRRAKGRGGGGDGLRSVWLQNRHSLRDPRRRTLRRQLSKNLVREAMHTTDPRERIRRRKTSSRSDSPMAVRADLEPQLHRPRPDRRAGDAWPRQACRILRGDRGVSRHGGDPPVPNPGVHGDGTADGVGAGAHQRGEEQGLSQHAADRSAGFVRGQYTGYRSEDGVDPESDTETFIASNARSTTGAGPAFRFSCARASGWRRASGSSPSPSGSRRRACFRPARASVRKAPTI